MAAEAADQNRQLDAPRLSARRVRKTPKARRAELLAVAREVLASGAPADGGMADVARAANVSKGLLYHYFPNGRPELVNEVAQQLLDELIDRLDDSANVPFSSAVRLEHVLRSLIEFFDENPLAFRILFIEGGTDAGAGEVRSLARMHLATELAALMASVAVPAEEVLALSTGLMGFVLANVELTLGGQLDAETAWRASCRCANALLDAT